MKWREIAAAWFSTFFENALVSRVNRRIDIRMVRFCRSISLVEMCAGTGVAADRAPGRAEAHAG
jgi:hypothetical protein